MVKRKIENTIFSGKRKTAIAKLRLSQGKGQIITEVFALLS